MVGNDGGIARLGDVEIAVGPGALSETGKLTLREGTAPDDEDATVLSDVVEITASKPIVDGAKLTVRFRQGNARGPISLAVVSGGRWQPVPSEIDETGTARATLSHFSTWAVVSWVPDVLVERIKDFVAGTLSPPSGPCPHELTAAVDPSIASKVDFCTTRAKGGAAQVVIRNRSRSGLKLALPTGARVVGVGDACASPDLFSPGSRIRYVRPGGTLSVDAREGDRFGVDIAPSLATDLAAACTAGILGQFNELRGCIDNVLDGAFETQSFFDCAEGVLGEAASIFVTSIKLVAASWAGDPEASGNATIGGLPSPAITPTTPVPSRSSPRIDRTTTYREGVMVYASVFYSDPDNDGEGFGFRGAKGALWAEENHPFSNPSYGRVSTGKVDYPFNHACGQSDQRPDSDVEFWIYDKTGLRSPLVVVHLACSSFEFSPTSGAPGTAIVMSGTGCIKPGTDTASMVVTPYLTDSGGRSWIEEDKTQSGSYNVTPDPTGNWSTTFHVARDAPRGTYQIGAACFAAPIAAAYVSYGPRTFRVG